jgi:predicted P-loop ATPase
MVAGQAVEAVARDRPFHPLRDHLDGLVWDREARLDSWVLRYLGVADTPYARAVGKRWLISATARIFQPGCKADCVLILEGAQGIKKSSALKALSEPWFTDRLSDLGSKDAAMETRGVWVIEIAELDTMSRAEVGTIKAFISRTHDRFRPPYGKRLVDLPRQCVFAGSVNPEGGYLKDATGGRRFWPIRCGTIDLEALACDRDQLWAEAVARYRAGEPWWLETRNLTELAEEEQLDRYQGDAWDDPIRDYLLNEHEWLANGCDGRMLRQRARAQPLRDVSLPEVLEHALGMEKGRWTQADQNRVARCLISMGFQRTRMRRTDRGREWRYRADPTVDVRRGPSGPQS